MARAGESRGELGEDPAQLVLACNASRRSSNCRCCCCARCIASRQASWTMPARHSAQRCASRRQRRRWVGRSGLRALRWPCGARRGGSWRSAANAMSWMLLLRRDRKPLDPAAPDMGPHVGDPGGTGQFLGRSLRGRRRGSQTALRRGDGDRRRKGTIACLELVDARCAPARARARRARPSFVSAGVAWEGRVVPDGGVQLRRSASACTGRRDFPAGMGPRRGPGHRTASASIRSLHFHDGHWYLFANVAENGNSTWDELFLFVGDSLDGPFRPHPGQSDRQRRAPCPAGRAACSTTAASLIRPAQDCAPGYGTAVVFNEVLELGPTSTASDALAAGPATGRARSMACHTYNAAGGVEVLDARGVAPPGLRASWSSTALALPAAVARRHDRSTCPHRRRHCARPRSDGACARCDDMDGGNRLADEPSARMARDAMTGPPARPATTEHGHALPALFDRERAGDAGRVDLVPGADPPARQHPVRHPGLLRHLDDGRRGDRQARQPARHRPLLPVRRRSRGRCSTSAPTWWCCR